MTDAGFFRGTTAEQDVRFPDKQKKLLKTLPFPPEYQSKVDMRKVNVDIMKAWITSKISAILDNEDEILENFVLNQLECGEPDPRHIQINLTGFLNAKNAREFVCELWNLLLEAQRAPDGVPMSLVEERVKLERQLECMKMKMIKKEPVETHVEEKKPREPSVGSHQKSARKPSRSRSPSATANAQSSNVRNDRERCKEASPKRGSRSRCRRDDDYRSRSRSRGHRRDRFYDFCGSYGSGEGRSQHLRGHRSTSRHDERRSPIDDRFRSSRGGSPPQTKLRFPEKSSNDATRREPSPPVTPSNDRRTPPNARKSRKWSPIVWEETQQKRIDTEMQRSDGHSRENSRYQPDDRGEHVFNRRFNGVRDAGHRHHPHHSPERMPYRGRDRGEMADEMYNWDQPRREGRGRYDRPYADDFWDEGRRVDDDNDNWREHGERYEPMYEDRYRNDDNFADNYQSDMGHDSSNYYKGGGGSGRLHGRKPSYQFHYRNRSYEERSSGSNRSYESKHFSGDERVSNYSREKFHGKYRRSSLELEQPRTRGAPRDEGTCAHGSDDEAADYGGGQRRGDNGSDKNRHMDKSDDRSYSKRREDKNACVELDNQPEWELREIALRSLRRKEK